MHEKLSPQVAAELAALPYKFIRKAPISFDIISRNISSLFEVNLSDGAIKGISGGLPFQLFNRTYGFAITAKGKNDNNKDHHVIAIRGTKVMVPDWMSNLNIGFTTGPNNKDVHAGFMKAFNSLIPSFEQYISKHNPKHVYCVGHSLGGALATLTASWLQSKYGISTSIYTFGAPRVGDQSFATQIKAFIPTYRITHGMDPVPWIPLWPFMHADDEYLLASNKGARFSLGAHSMVEPTPGYINTAGSYKSYDDIANKISCLSARQRIKLDYKNRNQARFSAEWAQKISNALMSLLVDAGYSISALLNVAGSCTMTLYDVLARTIHKIVEISKSKKEDVKGLLGHMLVFAGQYHDVGSLTVALIRSVFEIMTRALYKMAGHALQKSI